MSRRVLCAGTIVIRHATACGGDPRSHPPLPHGPAAAVAVWRASGRLARARDDHQRHGHRINTPDELAAMVGPDVLRHSASSTTLPMPTPPRPSRLRAGRGRTPRVPAQRIRRGGSQDCDRDHRAALHGRTLRRFQRRLSCHRRPGRDPPLPPRRSDRPSEQDPGGLEGNPTPNRCIVTYGKRDRRPPMWITITYPPLPKAGPGKRAGVLVASAIGDLEAPDLNSVLECAPRGTTWLACSR